MEIEKSLAVILAGITATGILGGSYIANYVSKKVINPLFKEKSLNQGIYSERRPEAIDIALHADDIATAGILSGFKWIEPALPFMFNMMFLVIPYGAVIAYSSILAQEKNLLGVLPYFYVCLVMGMLASKISTQKNIDSGKHLFWVCASLIILIFTMISYINLDSSIHLLIAGFLFGVGYGILQPLFQAFVTGTTPREKRGVANSTYMLSYDIGIGIGALFMGCVQEGIGLE